MALLVLLAALACLPLAGCGSGADGVDGTNGLDGATGPSGPPGPTGPAGTPAGDQVNVLTADPALLAEMDLGLAITGISINSPPVITFTVQTSDGVPVVGIGQWFLEYNRVLRFTLCKLVPGEAVAGAGTPPDVWVDYIQSGGEPSYDSGRSGGTLQDLGNGTYVYTFGTDVTNVPGILWQPTLTHRLAGQLGDSRFPIQPLNFVKDFVPTGAPVTLRRNIATMASCNECHDGLVFHGRRFEVEYCVTCHNPDLAEGDGDMPRMIHAIHNGGNLPHLGDFSEVTYPQDVTNCRKCHEEGVVAAPLGTTTTEGDHWKTRPSRAACIACHEAAFSSETDPADRHVGWDTLEDTACQLCHTPEWIEEVHTSANPTPNNPLLPTGQRAIAYELYSASVDVNGVVTVRFNVLSDGSPLDLYDLPSDLTGPGRYPSFLLAWAMDQGEMPVLTELQALYTGSPRDFNNLGRSAAQPPSISLANLIADFALEYDDGLGQWVATIADPYPVFPEGATMRTVGIQGYFQQSLGGSNVSLHTPSQVVTVSGDTARRHVVDNAKCANCHEWFEGHGGNRVYNIDICAMCHVPNLSSSGRTLDTSHPEDTQNLRDMIHGIHSSGFRTRDYVHYRGGSHSGYYNWSEVTFPAEDGTSNCLLCHEEGTFEPPLEGGLLATTVRTTGDYDGQDFDTGAVADARDFLPNGTDWVNSPTASSCFYCHTSDEAMGHMIQNGALLSVPDGSWFTRRFDYGTPLESCAVCHGAGKFMDVNTVHAIK